MRIWTVSEEKAGTLTQVLGVARQLDDKPRRMIVDRSVPSWRKGWLSPYRGKVRGSPQVVVSCGGLAVTHVRSLAAECQPRPLTVHLAQVAPQFADAYDIVYVSRHDWGAAKDADPRNRKMIGVPHQISPELLRDLRPAARERWVPESGRAVTVLAGGPNRAYLYDDGTVDRLIAAVRELAEQGWTALVSTSRRSRPDLLPRLLAMQSPRIVVWDRTTENPYRDFLAAADALLVTKDSITMACEAITTGRPTYIFDLAKNPQPSRRLEKFEWFHADMSETLKLTRPFRGELAPYDYVAPAEAQRIAGEIEAAVAARPDLLAIAGRRKPPRKLPGSERHYKSLLKRTETLPSFARAFRHHDAWLRGQGLLGRPWFILGLAPDPVVPGNLPADTAFAYVRFAGRSALAAGLPPADLTLLPSWRDARADAGVEMKATLRTRRMLTLRDRLGRLLGRTQAADSEISTPELDDYVIKTLGSLFARDKDRPSTGVALVCFALAHGIERIVIAGISFEAPGYAYDRSKAPRQHIEEDRAALRRMAERFPLVTTTDESLHRATGIPLYRAEA